MTSAYRSSEHALTRRLSELSLTHDSPTRRLAYERRAARLAAGLVATTGGVLLFAVALAGAWAGRGWFEQSAFRRASAVLLIGADAMSLVVYAVARIAARASFTYQSRQTFGCSGDPVLDLARLETSSARCKLEQCASRWELGSVMWPLLGMSLLMPLTIHAVFIAFMGEQDRVNDIGQWIATSVIIVGHAHAVLCICAYRYARFLSRSTAGLIEARGLVDWVRAMGFTTLTAAVPGAALLGVPPLLTLVTGLLFVPAMYVVARRHLLEERAGLLAGR